MCDYKGMYVNVVISMKKSLYVFSLTLSIFLSCSGKGWAQAPATSAPAPRDFGVRVEKPAGDGTHYSQGSGVFLGHGLVLTAAHVVSVDPGNRQVTVLLDGRRVDAIVVRDGQAQNLDLALIRLNDADLSPARRDQPMVPICPANPEPSQPVSVVAMGQAVTAFTIPKGLTSDGREESWTNLLATGFKQGNSGGGVFSIRQNCLWGIVNLELGGVSKKTGKPIDLTAFVPASRIAPFLEGDAAR